MKKYNQKTGKLGEDIAIRYLEKHCYKILNRNIYFRYGEIDVLAEKDKILYFIEVKTRTNFQYGDLEDSISYYKLQRLEKSILYYLMDRDVDNDFELLFVFVFLDLKSKKASIKILEY